MTFKGYQGAREGGPLLYRCPPHGKEMVGKPKEVCPPHND
jgi:hypothetical protein